MDSPPRLDLEDRPERPTGVARLSAQPLCKRAGDKPGIRGRRAVDAPSSESRAGKIRPAQRTANFLRFERALKAGRELHRFDELASLEFVKSVASFFGPSSIGTTVLELEQVCAKAGAVGGKLDRRFIF